MYTAFYSPQSNASERVNRSLIAGIRAYLKGDHRQWDEKLSFISCALRNAFHQSIGSSPFHAVFGFDMVTHASSYELMRKFSMLNEPTLKLSRDDRLQLIRDDLRKCIKNAYERNRSQYNLRTRHEVFKIGQEVLRRNFSQSNFERGFNAKLSPTFVKAKVREKLGSHYYVLEDTEGRLVGTFHAKDIRT
uniref:Integrase catalytic domain-containing protein n=1 Tax=Stomoxys calcitrans TaxID=35570 RepID=A0A1I8NPH8_STOCA